MTFKVGDFVKVLDGNKLRFDDDCGWVSSGMNEAIGHIYKIVYVEETWCSLDGIGYAWDKRWLVPEGMTTAGFDPGQGDHSAYQMRVLGEFPKGMVISTGDGGSDPQWNTPAQPPRYGYKKFDEKKNYWYLVKTEGEEPHWTDPKNWSKNLFENEHVQTYTNVVPGNPTFSHEALEAAKKMLVDNLVNEKQKMGVIHTKDTVIHFNSSGQKKMGECSARGYLEKPDYEFILISDYEEGVSDTVRYGIRRKQDGVMIDSCSGHNLTHKDFTKGTNLITNLMDKFMQLFEGEPMKSYKKSGVYDSNGMPTATGQQMFMKWLLDGKSPIAEAFRTEVVDKLIAEQEKEAKK